MSTKVTRHRVGLIVLANALAAATLAGLVLQLAAAPGASQVSPWGIPILLFTLTALAVGWIIAQRRPQSSIGWLLLVIVFLFGVQGWAEVVGYGLIHSAPILSEVLLSYGGPDSQWSWIPPIWLLFTQIPLRFPTGSLPSRRWAIFSWATIVALGLSMVLTSTSGRTVAPHIPNPFYVDWGDAVDLIGLIALGVFVPAFLGSIASLFVRYRQADAVERTQLRWVFWALAVVSGLLFVGWIENLVFGDDTAPGLPGLIANLLEFITGLGYSLVPMAILFAVLRYGLFSIDRIISRTAAYAIVTISTIVVYGAVVLVVSFLLPALPSVGVALATLLAAAVFLPLLRVVRRLVDRRFNRAQYDADEVVEAFGERIRTGVDPHTAGNDLVGAVSQTLQPSAVGLWTREDVR